MNPLFSQVRGLSSKAEKELAIAKNVQEKVEGTGNTRMENTMSSVNGIIKTWQGNEKRVKASAKKIKKGTRKGIKRVEPNIEKMQASQEQTMKYLTAPDLRAGGRPPDLRAHPQEQVRDRRPGWRQSPHGELH